MARLTGMGRLNSHSRKAQICSPKYMALRYKLVRSACNTKPKFDTAKNKLNIKLIGNKEYKMLEKRYSNKIAKWEY